jgi:hypothetical protein
MILVCMLVGLKFFVVSRTTGLYGLKFVKLSASADDFFIQFRIIGRFCYKGGGGDTTTGSEE